MKYVGSKGRHAKQILPIILAGRKEGQAYVEPFVGGANTIQHVSGRRIGGDLHKSLIDMWREVSKGWIPDPNFLSSGDHKVAKEKGDLSLSPQDTFLLFSLSFGGIWRGSYRRDRLGVRNYAEEAIRSAEKEFPRLRGVEFHHCSYDELPVPPQSVIYCDPPYEGTMEYKEGGFNHVVFWQWVRYMSGLGHKVFVSEYNAPDDFKCVWMKEVGVGVNKLASKRIERLFVHQSQYDKETT